MATLPSSEDVPGSSMSDEEYGSLRAGAALWVGASVLITDERGRVLVQHVDYRDTCLLPGGAVDKGESPSHAATREMSEELGVSLTVERGLAVDWVSADSFDAPPVMRFNGEILHVYDGGTWDAERISTIRLPEHEIESVEFAEPSRLPDLMSARDARRALSALRARIDGAGPVFLENGLPLSPTPLDRAAVLHTARPRHHFPFHAGPVPAGLRVCEARGWLLAPDGRVLLLLDPDTGTARLPGGAPEPRDGGDPVATLRREAREEAASRFGDPVLLGHLPEPDEPRTRVRYAAALTGVGPADVRPAGVGQTGVDRTDVRPPSLDRADLGQAGVGRAGLGPAIGGAPTRVLVTPEQAVELFDWGPSAEAQLAAVHQARERLGIPRAGRRPVTELTAPADWSSSPPG
ncbi:NUDIX hydrolase [Streptomyces sp. NPDC090298]|uniref:NUDIX hydrolase n=1 Tax=Streptomyces sp. NPDC090298 TaxID=3365959 RepID=UPI00382DED1C